MVWLPSTCKPLWRMSCFFQKVRSSCIIKDTWSLTWIGNSQKIDDTFLIAVIKWNSISQTYFLNGTTESDNVYIHRNKVNSYTIRALVIYYTVYTKKCTIIFDWTCIQQLSDLTQSAHAAHPYHCRLNIHHVELFSMTAFTKLSWLHSLLWV